MKISWSYGDPRESRKGLNPYQRLPERSRWTEFEVRMRADGTAYRVERWASRWAGTYAEGEWRVVRELTVAELASEIERVGRVGRFPGEADAWRLQSQMRAPRMRDRWTGKLRLASKDVPMRKSR